MIVVGFSLDASDIGAVHEFSKAKASNVFVLNSSFDVLSVFLSAQVEERLHIQKPMHTHLDGEGGVVVDVCAADETECVGVLEILIIWQVD